MINIKKIIEPARSYAKSYTGEGVIPCNPNDLIERMELLLASKKAGNTGLDTELEMIFKTLYEKNILNKSQLRKLYHHIS